MCFTNHALVPLPNHLDEVFNRGQLRGLNLWFSRSPACLQTFSTVLTVQDEYSQNIAAYEAPPLCISYISARLMDGISFSRRFWSPNHDCGGWRKKQRMGDLFTFAALLPLLARLGKHFWPVVIGGNFTSGFAKHLPSIRRSVASYYLVEGSTIQFLLSQCFTLEHPRGWHPLLR